MLYGKHLISQASGMYHWSKRKYLQEGCVWGSIVKLTRLRFWFLQQLWVPLMLLAGQEGFLNWVLWVEVQTHMLLFLWVAWGFLSGLH